MLTMKTSEWTSGTRKACEHESMLFTTGLKHLTIVFSVSCNRHCILFHIDSYIATTRHNML